MIQQLEKSQDMLMNFQQELNATEQELQRQREENKRSVLCNRALETLLQRLNRSFSYFFLFLQHSKSVEISGSKFFLLSNLL